METRKKMAEQTDIQTSICIKKISSDTYILRQDVGSGETEGGREIEISLDMHSGSLLCRIDHGDFYSVTPHNLTNVVLKMEDEPKESDCDCDPYARGDVYDADGACIGTICGKCRALHALEVAPGAAEEE
jgi:hypothetical protein